MASNIDAKKNVLSLDWDILDASAGFSLDIGGSAVKVVYIPKDDWVEPAKRKKDSKGKVCLVTFSRDEIKKAIEFIKTHAKIMRRSPDSQVNIFSTGLGGSQFSKLLAEQLNVVNTNLVEWECFVHVFHYMLKELPRREIFHPFNMMAFQKAMPDVGSTLKMISRLQNVASAENNIGDLPPPPPETAAVQHPQAGVDPNSHKPMVAQDNLFPCLLVICGSAYSFQLVTADGGSMMIDSSTCGGKLFQGLGSLLTNTKTYSELMSLCESGSALNVSTTNKSLSSTMEKGDKDDTYNIILNDDEQPEKTIFSFGKAAGKTIGDFKKNDLAKCLLETMVLSLVHLAYYVASSMKVKHIFFCGGFVSHPLPREIITEEWLKRDMMNTFMDPAKEEFTRAYFLKYSASLGAIGALMKHKQQSKNKSPMAGEPPLSAATKAGYKESVGI